MFGTINYISLLRIFRRFFGCLIENRLKRELEKYVLLFNSFSSFYFWSIENLFQFLAFLGRFLGFYLLKYYNCFAENRFSLYQKTQKRMKRKKRTKKLRKR